MKGVLFCAKVVMGYSVRVNVTFSFSVFTRFSCRFRVVD